MTPTQIATCRDLFNDNPTPIAIFHAKSLKLEHANPAILKLWDRSAEVIGLTILDFLPELADQQYPDLLRNVGRSNKPHHDYGSEVKIVKEGKLSSVYMDYSYTPFKGTSKFPTAILVIANEISERQLNMLSSDEHIRNLRAMVLAAPVAMCIFRGWDMKVEVVNSHMLDLWQDREYRNLNSIRHVFHGGHPLEYVEHGIRYSCTALRNGEGISVGCVLIAMQVA